MINKKLSHLSNDDLQALAHHNIHTEVLLQYCDPFAGCWMELKTPITKEEIKACIDNGQAQLVDTPLWSEVIYSGKEINEEQSRANHIKKIAYFAINDIEKPISLDVGIPEMNSYVSHMVDDGNHRLAGAIYKGQKFIKCTVGGSTKHAQDLCLYQPNEYETELFARYEKEQADRAKKPAKKIKMLG